MILTGKNLGERQKEFNLKVKEAAEKNIDFNAFIATNSEIGNSDIDSLFKIDLAAKFKNVDYIVEILKCGDRLHISRAFRAMWLYDDEYLHIINPLYLKNNIFPFMSLKMKKYFLAKISLNLQNGNRAIDFYKYCVEEHLEEISYKFLLITPQSFKLEYLEQSACSLASFVSDRENEIYLQHFLENSFILTQCFVQKNCEYRGTHVLYTIRHMYSVSHVKYLDLVDKYNANAYARKNCRLGLRISKSIMQKYKDRVLAKPLEYLTLLEKNTVVKYSSTEDAKLYLPVLLPKKSSEFWDCNFWDTYKYIIDLIPLEDRFEFVKKKFCGAYPGEEFETSKYFVTHKYYDYMTLDAREDWILKYIQSEEIKGTNNYYEWYKFVNFPKAFREIKKLIQITEDRKIRNDMVNVLIHSAKTQRDLEALFSYYYERHVNELHRNKCWFLNSVIYQHHVLVFDEKCWTAFHNILSSLDIYNKCAGSNCDEFQYAYISLVYHIIHGLEIDNKHTLILKHKREFYNIRDNRDCRITVLSPEMEDIVYQYLVVYFTNEIKKIEPEPKNDDIKTNLRFNISALLKILNEFNKTKEQCPEIVMKYIKQDWDHFKRDILFYEAPKKPKEITQQQIIRDLKKDASLVVNELPLVKEYIEVVYDFKYKLNFVARKLRVYFSNDIAKIYLQFFKDLVADKLTGVFRTGANIGMLGIFELADNNFKVDFMAKYAPVESKIDYNTIDRHLLAIQEAICRFACYSRPPVPLDSMMMYLKGDYVHNCLPMFNMYSANLPLPLCIEFITRVLDSPVSIRKHGLRLAFQCFSTDNLKRLTLDIWKKTKNTSLRTIIYTKLLEKILNEEKRAHRDLLDALTLFIRDLHENDNDELFDLLTCYKIPDEFITEIVEAGWSAVSKLPIKSKNLKRMSDLIRQIRYKIEVVKNISIRPIIDEHIKTMLVEKQIRSNCDLPELEILNTEKWNLAAVYITHVNGDDNLNDNLVLLRLITKNCFEMWDEVDGLKYPIRNFYTDFTRYLILYSPIKYTSKLIVEDLLKDIEDALPLHKRYLYGWKFRLDIIRIDLVSKLLAKVPEQNNTDAETQLVKESIFNFGCEIAMLVKEYVEKGLFFRYMSQSILDIIKIKLIAYHNNLPSSNVNLEDVYVVAALALTNIEISETFFIALHILPHSYERLYQKDYKNAIEKIRAFENTEIQCCLNEQFLFIDSTPKE